MLLHEGRAYLSLSVFRVMCWLFPMRREGVCIGGSREHLRFALTGIDWGRCHAFGIVQDATSLTR